MFVSVFNNFICRLGPDAGKCFQLRSRGMINIHQTGCGGSRPFRIERNIDPHSIFNGFRHIDAFHIRIRKNVSGSLHRVIHAAPPLQFIDTRFFHGAYDIYEDTAFFICVSAFRYFRNHGIFSGAFPIITPHKKSDKSRYDKGKGAKKRLLSVHTSHRRTPFPSYTMNNTDKRIPKS